MFGTTIIYTLRQVLHTSHEEDETFQNLQKKTKMFDKYFMALKVILGKKDE